MARQIWSKLLHGMPVVCEAWLIEQSLYQNQTYVSVGGGGGVTEVCLTRAADANED